MIALMIAPMKIIESLLLNCVSFTSTPIRREEASEPALAPIGEFNRNCQRRGRWMWKWSQLTMKRRETQRKHLIFADHCKLSPLVWQLHLFLSGKSQLARRRPMQSHSARVYTTHVMSAGILHFILKMHCNILSVCTFLGSGVWRQVLIELDGPVTDPISHLYPRSPFIYATLYIHHTFIRAVYTSYIFICTTYILAAISIFLTGFAWMSVLFFNCLLTCSNWKRAKGQTQCQRISIFPTFLHTENTIYTLLVFYELWDLSHVKPVRWRDHRGEVLRSWLSRNSAALPSSVISELYRTSHILCGFCETDQNVSFDQKRATR